MPYLVNLTARAMRDLEFLYERIRAIESEAASRWFHNLEDAIYSLENNPGRCPFTAENKELRHLLYGRKPNIYRVIYMVHEQTKIVEVLHIRHGARDEFTA